MPSNSTIPRDKFYRYDRLGASKLKAMPKTEVKGSTYTHNYYNLSRINLLRLAHSLGIKDPQNIGKDDLRLRIVSAHRVQQLYEGREADLSSNSKVYSCQHLWQAAIQLRLLGITDETIIILLKNGIRSLEQLKGLTFKVFVDSGITPAQAEILVLNFCENKQLNNPPDQMQSGAQYPNMASMISARFRCQTRTWPCENIPFLTFLETFEYDLQLADPTGAEWVDFFRGALLGRSRCIAERAIMRNPGISYEELKEIVKAGQISDADITNSFKILQSKYEPQADIVRHIEQVKNAVKFIYPNCPDEALIIILLLTLPSKLSQTVRKDLNIHELPSVEARLLVEAPLIKPIVRSSKKNADKQLAVEKNHPVTKKNCIHCGKNDHKSKKCPLKAKKKKSTPEVIKIEN